MATPKIGLFNQALASNDLNLATELAREILNPSAKYPKSIVSYILSRLPSEYHSKLYCKSDNCASPDIEKPILEPFIHHPDAHLLRPQYNLPVVSSETIRDQYTEYRDHKEFFSCIKTIAFYLPQYHPFPENDFWWGKGFTEWTNVGKALPMFAGHYQPHCPIHFGYYDLRIVDNMIEQAELAKNYGIYGFSYYYYWFNGKVIMDRPLLNMLKEPKVDIPFCLTWANENWTRRWDGKDDEILLQQTHSLEDSARFLRSLESYFLDSRYIKHQGRPVLIVYRADIIPKIQDTIRMWRDLAVEMGFPGLYLIAAQSFGLNDPTKYGFDAAVEFPPHGVVSNDICHQMPSVDQGFKGSIYDYNQVVNAKTSESLPTFKQHFTCMLSWDNTARKKKSGSIFAKFSLGKFQVWLEANISKTIQLKRQLEDYPLLTFINAWNEWAEGTHLEPDQRYGYGYLEATHSILSKFRGTDLDYRTILKQSDPRSGLVPPKSKLIILHCYYLDICKQLLHQLSSRLQLEDCDIYVSTDEISKAVELKKEYPQLIIDILPNIGRDILPFISILRSIVDSNVRYERGLKLHTKKTVYRSDGHEIRERLLASLLSNECLQSAEKISSDNRLGLIVPKVSLIELDGKNGDRLRYHRPRISEICNRLTLERVEPLFPAGSMFWFNPAALMPLLKILTGDFAPEIGLSDGTCAHTIERLFISIAKSSGFFIDSV